MATTRDDRELVARLRAGDEHAFSQVVAGWSPVMLRLARAHVSTRHSAEEVVQEAWLAVLRGLDGFEGRSSLKTWVLRIVVNTAKTRGVREQRSLPWASAFPDDEDGATADRRLLEQSQQRWRASPESSALDVEVRELVTQAIEALPPRQRSVITLRDVEGCSSEEVCQVLDLSAANQRVLLHRARAAVRADLEHYLRVTAAEAGETVNP